MKIVWIGLCGCLSLHAQAFEQVPPMIHQVAKEQGVPADIFYALLLAESQSQTRMGLKPWPWSLNYRGQAHYFPDRFSAFSYAEDLVNQGEQVFDIGIAQVNWRWHRERFNFDLWSAFDPYLNLSAAAAHLREQYARPSCNHWALAIGCYHRPARGEQDIDIAHRYAQKVIEIWEEQFYTER